MISPHTIARQPLGQQHEIVIPYRVPSCMIGYGMTVAAAARLADHKIPFFRPVDEDMKFFWESGIRDVTCTTVSHNCRGPTNLHRNNRRRATRQGCRTIFEKVQLRSK